MLAVNSTGLSRREVTWKTMREKYGLTARTIDRSPNVPTANMENTSEDKCWVWHNWHDVCQTFISFMVSDSSLN